MIIINTATLRRGDALSPDHASWIYNGLDCCVTNEVYSKLIPLLDNETRAVYELEKELQGPVLDMNMHGILVDKVELFNLRAQFSSDIERIRGQLNRILKEGYGTEFNYGDPRATQTFLYEYLRLPKKFKKNQKGQRVPTADRDALEALSIYPIAAPFCDHMLLIRDYVKVLGFLNTEIDPDGYLRTAYNIAGTNTGRLSSKAGDFGTGTNTQNIDRRLRRIFIAAGRRKICTIDLEQADSRNVGANCWAKFLSSHGAAFAGAYLDACESGDLHTAVTRMAWRTLEWGDDPGNFRSIADGIAYRDLTYRDLAKRLGHGTNYYGQPPTMAKHSKIPVQVASNFQELYFAAFPAIRAGHEWVKRTLADDGTLSTLFGRRRRFFGRPDADETLREAIAYEGQGSTGDQANRGMLAVWRGGRKFPGFQLLKQDHDAISFEYDPVCEDEIIPWAVEAMQIPLILPGDRRFVVPAEPKVGWNLGDFNDKPFDKNGRPLVLNVDGMKKWKGGDTRIRSVEPRLQFALQ